MGQQKFPFVFQKLKIVNYVISGIMFDKVIEEIYQAGVGKFSSDVYFHT